MMWIGMDLLEHVMAVPVLF